MFVFIVYTEIVTYTQLYIFNPLKCSDIRWLHFKVFRAIQV